MADFDRALPILDDRLNALIRKRIFATATQAERIEALYLYRKLLGRECNW